MAVRLGYAIPGGVTLLSDQQGDRGNNRGQIQCCSLNNFWRPVMPEIERLISFAWQEVLGSSLDPAGVGSLPGAGKPPIGHRLNQGAPPFRELL